MFLIKNKKEAESPSTASYQMQLELQRLQDECVIRDSQFAALRRTSLAAMQSDTVDELTERILDIAVRVTHATAGSVYLHRPATRHLVFTAVIGDASAPLVGTTIDDKSGIAGHVFQTGLPILDDNLAQHSVFDPANDLRTGFETKSTITIPLCAPGGTPVGILQVLNGQNPFTQRELSVLEVLCTHTALGIDRIRLTALSRDAQIGHRVGEIAHDIKNLMTPIESGGLTAQALLIGLIHDLKQVIPLVDEPCQGMLTAAIASTTDASTWILDDIVSSADRVRRRTAYIAAMVRGMLPEPQLEQESIATVIQQVQKTLGRIARDRKIDFYCNVEKDISKNFYDKDHMYDALYNLVNNAIQATPDGGNISLTAHNSRNKRNMIEINVTDTGHGMTEETRSRLFTDSVVSTKRGGTGLGTSIVGRIIREHHGTVLARTQLGRGSVFTIELPTYPPNYDATKMAA